jgi:hypothetical protein
MSEYCLFQLKSISCVSARPMLYDDTDKTAAEALRKSVVAQAQPSPTAVKKQTTGLTEDGLPVHSFQTLLADLATVARNTITTAITPHHPTHRLYPANPDSAKGFQPPGRRM